MLPISELVRFGAGLDDDWHHPVADAAAVRWGLDRPVFVRSSASHVMVARSLDGGPRRVLRMRPDAEPHPDVLARAASAATALADAGAPVARAVPSAGGDVVEHVDGLVVTAHDVVEGDALDEDDVDAVRAEHWGETLARFHQAGQAVGRLPSLPHTTDPLDGTDVARELRHELDRLPRDPAVHGVLHGDPEPDNVVVGPTAPTLVDLDDVRTGWFVSDVGFALRAWADGPTEAPDLHHRTPSAFVRGYRSVRPLTDEELGRLPLMARVAAYEEWRDLQRHVRAEPDPTWPDWALALDEKVRARVALLSSALVSG
jgi:Ser/Thr protein kinase RdoA (MazF antagonist)